MSQSRGSSPTIEELQQDLRNAENDSQAAQRRVLDATCSVVEAEAHARSRLQVIQITKDRIEDKEGRLASRARDKARQEQLARLQSNELVDTTSEQPPTPPAEQPHSSQERRLLALGQEEDEKRTSSTSSRETAPAPEVPNSTEALRRYTNGVLSSDDAEPRIDPSLNVRSDTLTPAAASRPSTSGGKKGKKRAADSDAASPALKRTTARTADKCPACTDLDQVGAREFGSITCDVAGCEQKHKYCYRHFTSGTATLPVAIRSAPYIAVCKNHRGIEVKRLGSKDHPRAVEMFPYFKSIDAEIEVDGHLKVYDYDGEYRYRLTGLELQKRKPLPKVYAIHSLAFGGDYREYATLEYQAAYSPRLLHQYGFTTFKVKQLDCQCDGCGRQHLRILEQGPLKCQYAGCSAVTCALCAKVAHNPLGWLCETHLSPKHQAANTTNWKVVALEPQYVVQTIYKQLEWNALDTPSFTDLFLTKHKDEEHRKERGGLFDCEVLGFPNQPRDGQAQVTATAFVTRGKLLECVATLHCSVSPWEDAQTLPGAIPSF